MRVYSIVLAFLIIPIAGCVGDDGIDPVAIVDTTGLCRAPCEVAVDTSDRRAFEPAAALDPADPDRAVIVSTLFRDSEDLGHPMDFYVHRTEDRGANWDTQRFWDMLGPDHPAKQYTMWADPMLLWHDDGTLLLLGMGGTGANPPPGPVPVLGFTGFDIWTARSFDGGATWADGTVVLEGDGVTTFAPTPATIGDQPHLAAGPDGSLLLGVVRTTSNPLDGEWSDIVAFRSTDVGATWSEGHVVATGPNIHNPRPAVLDDGTMLMAYRTWADGQWERGPVHVARSTDGQTWDTIRTFPADSRPTMASTGEAAHLAVLQLDNDGQYRMRLLTTTDAGETWTSIELDAAERRDEVIMTASGTRAGDLYVTWNRPVAGGVNEYWAAHLDESLVKQRIDSNPLGSNGLAGVKSIRWSSLGDYFGLAATGDVALAAWISGEGGGQDVRAAWLQGNPAPT